MLNLNKIEDEMAVKFDLFQGELDKLEQELKLAIDLMVPAFEPFRKYNYVPRLRIGREREYCYLIAELNANRLRDVMASYKPSQPDLYGYASGRDGFKDTSMKFTAETIAKYFLSDDGYGKNIARQFSELVRGHLYRNRAKK